MKVKRSYKINYQIHAAELRVLDSQGKQLGVMPIAKALELAKKTEADLIEIAADAKPPVAKIIEFNKFKYLEDKKEKEARKNTKQTELKEVRFSPFIGEHDLETGVEKAKKFLSEGNIVKISIIFTYRQMVHQEFGPKLLAKIMEKLPNCEHEREARFEGKRYITIIRQSKGQKREPENEKPKT